MTTSSGFGVAQTAKYRILPGKQRWKPSHFWINAAPEQQPYRNAAEIRDLFSRLGIPVRRFEEFASCSMAQIQESRESLSGAP